MKKITLEIMMNSKFMQINSIKGFATLLSEVTIVDSPRICELRNQNNKYLSSTKQITIAQQEQWIINNIKRNDSYYFKVIDLKDMNIVGTISLYDIKDGAAEFGRYICNKTLQAVESELLMLKYGFEIIKLDRIYCRTMEDNKLVWNQHYKYGFKDLKLEYFEKKKVYLKVQELTKENYFKYDYSKIRKIISINI